MVARRRSSVRPDHPLRPFLLHARCRDGMDAPCSGVECARMEVSLLQTREHP